MPRSAAQRLFLGAWRRSVCRPERFRFSHLPPQISLPSSSYYLSSPPFSTHVDPPQSPSAPILNPHRPVSESSSSPEAEGDHHCRNRRGDQGVSGGERKSGRTDYKDEQARVLQASLRHVPHLGWAEPAMIEGAREVGVSPSIVGSFPRKEAALVEYFMDECLQKLIDKNDSDEELRSLIPSDRVSRLVKFCLEMHAPYISKWPQALSIQAQPMNVPTSFKQRALLVDEIWHAVGDEASDVDWYVKRTVLAGIYSTTEVYMLTDSSPDFRDTWAFLDDRIRDAFELKKTIQEAKYLAEAVGAGMGNSLQGFMKKVFRG